MLTLVCYVLHLIFIGLKELQTKNYTMTYQRLQKQNAIVGQNFQDTHGDMMKNLCTTCFFGCQQMKKTKEEGHRNYILTNSLKTQDYRWKNLKTWWPTKKSGNPLLAVISPVSDSTSECEWVSDIAKWWVKYIIIIIIIFYFGKIIQKWNILWTLGTATKSWPTTPNTTKNDKS